MTRAPLAALVGPTASGKTEVSIPIAEALHAEILCIDSMLVYRGMDVGTAKPPPPARARVRHHLLDLVEPDEAFSVARFHDAAESALHDVEGRGRRPLLVSGGGLYYRAVVDRLEFPATAPSTRSLLEAEAAAVGPRALYRRLAGLDPAAAGKIEPSNARRTIRALEVAAVTGRPFSSFGEAWGRYPAAAVRAAGVRMPRAALHRRIERRVLEIMPGLLAETASLLDRGHGGFLTSVQAIGYAEAMAHLQGRIGLDESIERAVRRTKGLARRQLAWLTRDPRVHWFEVGEEGAAGAWPAIARYLEGKPAPADLGASRMEA